MSRAPPSNCLFLPELPVDLTDATLERHFRGFVGFQVARTRHDRNGKLVGFVEFDAVDDAVRCRESMQGASPFEGISWHIHYSNNTKGTPKRPREEMEQPVGRMEAQRPMYDRPNNQQMMPPPPGAPMMQSSGGGYGGPHGGPHHGGPLGPHHGPHGGPPGPMYQPMGPGPGPMGPVPAGSSIPPNYMSQLPRDASSTLYVEGLPSDATEREVAHIFRRFEGHGYQSIRMLARESSKTPGKNLYLCFVEFDNPHQATACLHQMQGYRVDRAVEGGGIKISFAKSKGDRGGRPAGGGGGGGPPRGSGGGAPSRGSESDERSRGSDRMDDRRDSAEPEQHDYRRRGEEHRDSYRDDYEDSERGDDDYKDHRGVLDSISTTP